MGNFLILVIAVSLSMDAFSLSLAFGTLNLNKSDIFKLSLVVGIYHYFMPLLGLLFGKIIYHIIPISPEIIVFLVLTFIGITMIIDTYNQNENINIMKFGEILLFGFAVSLDSFSVGIGLRLITSNVVISFFIFSITSFVFTYLGLFLGKKISNKVGKISTIMGGIMLILLSFIYLLK